MNHSENPLLTGFWRAQFRLRDLHRSSIVSLALGFALLTAALQLGLRVNAEAHWRKSLWIHFHILWIASSVWPSIEVASALSRLRRDGRLESLLATPVSARDWCRGLLIPPIAMHIALWTGAVLVIVPHCPAFHFEINAGQWLLGHRPQIVLLLFSLLFAIVQVCFCSTLTLRILLTRRGPIRACVWSLLIAALLWLLAGITASLLTPVVHPPLRESIPIGWGLVNFLRHWLDLTTLVCGFQLLATWGMIQGMSSDISLWERLGVK